MALHPPRPDLLGPYERVLEQVGDEPSTPLDVFAVPEGNDRPSTISAQALPPSRVVAEAA